MKFSPLCRSVVENASDIIMVTDATPVGEGGPLIVYVNPAFEQLMGYRSDEVIGKTPAMFYGPDTDRHTHYKIRKALREAKEIRTEILNYTRDGQPIWLDINVFPMLDSDGNVEYFAAIERDLTEQKRQQARLEIMATIDPLTELPNRQHILKTARREFSRSKRYHRPLSLMMIDIDHFKKVNDQYGHVTGDKVLAEVARICGQELRDPDILGRIGGEEFVLLLPDTPEASALHVAERMRARLANTLISIDGNSFHITASFGVVERIDSDEDFTSMLDRADMAMYEAKQGGRNRVRSAA